MTLRFKTLKPGSILVYKRHNLFKRLWYKLIKKDIEYNRAELFTDYITIFDSFSPDSPTLLLEPKKAFSNDECKKLSNLAEEFTSERNIYSIVFDDKKIREMFAILGKVRPNTGIKNTTEMSFSEFDNKIRKNYYVKRLAEEKNWDVCIY